MSKIIYAEVYEFYKSRNQYVSIFGTPNIKEAEQSYLRHLAEGDKVIIRKTVEYKPNIFKRLWHKLTYKTPVF